MEEKTPLRGYSYSVEVTLDVIAGNLTNEGAGAAGAVAPADGEHGPGMDIRPGGL